MMKAICVFAVMTLAACGSAVVREGDSLWRNPIISHSNCMPLDGDYADKGLLFRQFNDSSTNYGTSRFSSPVRYEREIVPSGATNPREQQKNFDATAFVRVKSNAASMEVTLHGGDGLPYAGRVISYGHPNVGCDANGNLVLREFSRIGGAELTPGEARASEAVFRRLGDGSLEVDRSSRNWIRSMKIAPKKESKATLVFPRAH